MRILFATDQYLPTPGGISIVTQRISVALAKKGHSVAIIAPSTSWKFKRELKDNVVIFRIQSLLVHKLKQLRFSPTFLYWKRIEHIVNNFKPDIIHLETPNTIANETLQVAKKYDIPVIATCHIMPENISGTLPFLPSKIGKMVGNIYMKQIVKLFNKVDFVTAPTLIGTAILDAYNIDKPKMALSNGIDLLQFQQPSKDALQKLRKKYNLPDLPLILYIGRLDKEKKVDILIKSLQYLKKTQPFHCLIEGKGQQMEALQSLVQKLELQNKVSFIGYVDQDELSILYAISTVFVMPSTAELQSLVTMEAMAMGLPIIGAQAGALPYLIKPNQNGFLFEPDNPVDLADKLQQILEAPPMQKRMSKESLSLIKEHDINNIIEKMEALYAKVINDHKKATAEKLTGLSQNKNIPSNSPPENKPQQ
jgi:glycosyltransferase involved in cell wall biosynthesis